MSGSFKLDVVSVGEGKLVHQAKFVVSARARRPSRSHPPPFSPLHPPVTGERQPHSTLALAAARADEVLTVVSLPEIGGFVGERCVFEIQARNLLPPHV